MEKVNKIRSFIAIELSQEARSELASVIGSLKRSGADVKWCDPEGIHLTLKFLGGVPEEDIPKIAERMKAAVSAVPSFEMVMAGIGAFPKWDYAKVLWVGLETGSDNVKDLASAVEEAMSLEGFEKEDREFKPHLTIGRVRGAKNKKALKELALSLEVNPVSIYISRVVLFRSDLGPKGAVYTRLADAPLR